MTGLRLLKRYRFYLCYTIVSSALILSFILYSLIERFAPYYPTVYAGDAEKFVTSLNNPKTVVPDEKTAVAIADFYLKQKYGNKIIFYYPYKVSFDNKNGVWIICGVGHNIVSFFCDLYEPTIIIRQSDGSIINIFSMKF